MLNKTIYETDKHKIIIQRTDGKWLVQVFEGTGGTKIIEWKEFSTYRYAIMFVNDEFVEVIT